MAEFGDIKGCAGSGRVRSGLCMVFVLAVSVVFGAQMDGSADLASSAGLTEELAAVDVLRQEGRYSEALERLQAVLGKHSARAEILWRQSWTKVDLGEASDGEAAMRKFYEGALSDAKAAIAADERNARAHLVYAIAAGRLALISPTRKKVELSRKVKAHADRALECDPDLAAAYHVRAMWHREVAAIGGLSRAVLRLVYGGLPEASYAAAVADFEKSIELEEHVGDRLELARTCLAMGDPDRARRELERALTLPVKVHQDRKHRETARQLLEEIK